MRIALETGPSQSSAWAHERRWHGPAAALLVHLAIASLWLAWPAAPPPALEDPVVELVLAPSPPPRAEPQPPIAAAPVAAPAKPVPVRPAPVKPAAVKSAATPAAAPATGEEAPAAAPPVPIAPAIATPPAPAQSELDRKPTPTEAPRPVYPRAARQRGWQGVVMVLVRVAEDGLPLEVAVKESSGHSVLDEAALDAVKRWRFAPARHGGKPVAAAVAVPVRFSLEG